MRKEQSLEIRKNNLPNISGYNDMSTDNRKYFDKIRDFFGGAFMGVIGGWMIGWIIVYILYRLYFYRIGEGEMIIAAITVGMALGGGIVNLVNPMKKEREYPRVDMGKE